MQRRSTSILARLVPAVVAVLLVVSVLPTSSAHASGARRYARPLGQPVGACDTWANACELYYALQVSAANSGGEVWARGGTYTPNPSSASNSLVVGEGVLLYGGFTGEETALSQRKPSVNITTLSGDLNLDGTWTGNSVHVVTLTGVSSATLVDGFAIVQGYANSGGLANDGGGMLINGGAPRVQHVSFVDNYASNGGGGLAVVGSASPTLTNLSFSDNVGTAGGGMFVTQSTPSLSKAYFSNNVGILGGGVATVTGGDAVLNNVTFTGNTANYASFGGGMYNQASAPKLTNVTFIGNSSAYGGGLYNSSAIATLSRVRFNGNSAIISGGGMYTNSASGAISLTDVSFYANEARTGAGGAMYTNASANTNGLTLKNVTVANNVALTYGGGLYNLNSTLSLINVTLSGNDGDGFYNDGSTLTLKFVTVSNSADLGMLNVNSSIVSISSSIFWNDFNGEIGNTLGTTVSFSHGIMQGGCGPNFTTCTAVNKNPQLGSLKANGGFTKTMALASTSPAIDKVSCLSVKTDQRGVKRPQGPKCDIGAYERKP